MGTLVSINKEKIAEAKEVIENKKEVWLKAFPNLNFDDNGRAKVGEIPSFDEGDFYRSIKNSTSKLFEECLFEACAKLRIKPINLQEISYTQYLSRRVDVETITGNKQERSLPSILSRASLIWETKLPMYRPLRNIYKERMRSRDVENMKEASEIELIQGILKEMEVGNTYMAYDELMRVFQPESMYISINPLDKLFSSGGENTNSITKFFSCWSNKMRVLKNGDVSFTAYGSYSNPSAQVLLGEHPMCGMLIIPNKNKINIHGMEFFGMLQRSHIWLCNDEAIFIENIYPDKTNYERRKIITSILNETIKVIEPREKFTINFPKKKSGSDWYRVFREKCSEGHSPYLDRSTISRNGNISIKM